MNNNDFTELMTNQDASAAIISDINKASDNMYVSFEATTLEDKKNLYNLTSSNGESFMDNDGVVISMKDCAIIPTVVENNGAENVVPRVCVMTADGKYYSGCSFGLYRALVRIKGIFGTLHFEDGLDVMIKVIKTKNGKTVNLQIM